jgi:hypothetical protein
MDYSDDVSALKVASLKARVCQACMRASSLFSPLPVVILQACMNTFTAGQANLMKVQAAFYR